MRICFLCTKKLWDHYGCLTFMLLLLPPSLPISSLYSLPSVDAECTHRVFSELPFRSHRSQCDRPFALTVADDYYYIIFTIICDMDFLCDCRIRAGVGAMDCIYYLLFSFASDNAIRLVRTASDRVRPWDFRLNWWNVHGIAIEANKQKEWMNR